MAGVLRILLFVSLGLSGCGVLADETAQQLYETYQDSILRIEVITPGMEKKASLGTGFVIGEENLVASNFHVVSSAVHEPDRYRLEWSNTRGERGQLSVVAVDVVHDLALLKADQPLASPLVTTGLPKKGAELYSLGHPLALDLSIVAGTANGLLENSIYEKIHFSGGINPGMSGGPALDQEGRVVGVNVASAGNSVGFLVPAHYVEVMLMRADPDGESPDITRQIGEQLIENQDRLINELLESEWRTQTIGKFQVPGEVSSRLDCWGDTEPETDDHKYLEVATNCNGRDAIFLSDRQSAGSISHQYFWLATDSLSPRSFYRLYQQHNNSRFIGGADETDVGNFTCSTRFVNLSGQSFKANVCARPYKRYPELTDFMVLMAMTGHPKQGFLFTLDLSTVTLENGMRLLERFLEGFQWIE
ncbi:S1 family peptidase [Aurantivibrio plasticivorans]